MNSYTGMFKLQPHYNFDQVQMQLPDCMFKMPNFQEGAEKDKDMPVSTSVSGDPALVALEQRQVGILGDLRSLETEVAALAAKIDPAGPAKSAAAAVPSSQGSANNQSSHCLHDVVVYANPNNPPYSLLVLYEQLRQQFRCTTRVHAHSSVASVPERLLRYFGQNGAQSLNRGEAQIALTLIWKNVTQGPEMRIQANAATPIQGEVNILRYLSRLLTPAYDAADADVVAVATIDNYLDLASATVLNGSTKEKAAAVRTLNSALGKRAWLAGESPTVADIALWSTLHQTGLAGGAPSNVQKWLKACAARNEFRTALNAVA